MNLRRGSRTPLASRTFIRCLLTAAALVLALLPLSCGGGSSSSHATHNAYISLTSVNSVALFHITDSSGALSSVSNSVPQVGTGPVGLGLHPSGKFLYAANSTGDSVSTFNVAGDGTLTQAGNPTGAGLNPQGAVIDPSGKFLLVANASFPPTSGSISVFSIDSGTGALTLTSTFTGPPSLFGPTQIVMTSSGFAYVLTPSTNNAINAFTFSSGTLTSISSYFAGNGTSAIAVDPAGKLLYAANTSDNDVTGFTINADGSLTPIVGTYAQPPGTAPGALAVDTTGKFLYVATRGSSASIWVFAITPGSGILTPISGSPFNLSAGNSFLVMEPRGKYFYIGDSGSHKIAAYSYDPNTGAPTAISGSPFSIGSDFGQLLITP
jgi:6-phosphogluconolactonase (cycloisomerase 2 family)